MQWVIGLQHLKAKSPVAFKKGQGTRQPLPGSVASTSAIIECTADAAGAIRLQQFRSIQIRHGLSRSSGVAMLFRPWKTAVLSAQLLHTAAQTEAAVAGGGQRGWWTLQYALLQATYKPPSSAGGNPHPPKGSMAGSCRSLGGVRECKIGRIEQASWVTILIHAWPW